MWNVRAIKYRMPSGVYKLLNSGKDKFECPLCGYLGPFMDVKPYTGIRRHARCPKCGSYERHRIQKLVMNELIKKNDFSDKKMLHFAPEEFFSSFFSHVFNEYETADIDKKGVNYKVDLQALPFDNACYDFVYASHVLEHIPDDYSAISEIRRILKPNGIAVLPVPIFCHKTIEYGKVNKYEFDHVRAPGLDYLNRYKKLFSKIDTYSSEMFEEKYQTFYYENREKWPTKEVPLRTPMKGKRHPDIVPVCYA